MEPVLRDHGRFLNDPAAMAQKGWHCIAEQQHSPTSATPIAPWQWGSAAAEVHVRVVRKGGRSSAACISTWRGASPAGHETVGGLLCSPQVGEIVGPPLSRSDSGESDGLTSGYRLIQVPRGQGDTCGGLALPLQQILPSPNLVIIFTFS